VDFYFVKNLGASGPVSPLKFITKLGQLITMSVFCDISEDRKTLTCPCLQGGQVIIVTEAPLETFSGGFVFDFFRTGP